MRLIGWVGEKFDDEKERADQRSGEMGVYLYLSAAIP
jgi:hypothetical protein